MEAFQTVARTDLNIRTAQPADRTALEAIAAQVWDGEDYLPRVLDDWFADPYDGFFVATLCGRVVGVIKLTRFAAGEWWLEGLRVDPEYRRQNISRILHHFAIRQVRERGSGQVRFSTASENKAARTLARESGFEHVASFHPVAAEPLAEPLVGLRQLGPGDASAVRAYLDRSLHYTQARGSLEWDWCFYFLTDERLAERLEDGLVYGWMPDDATLNGVVITNAEGKSRWPDDPKLRVAYLDAPEAHLVHMALDVRRLAAINERARVVLKMLKRGTLLATMQEAGYEREWDGEVLLYERNVSLTEHADVRLESEG